MKLQLSSVVLMFTAVPKATVWASEVETHAARVSRELENDGDRHHQAKNHRNIPKRRLEKGDKKKKNEKGEKPSFSPVGLNRPTPPGKPVYKMERGKEYFIAWMGGYPWTDHHLVMDVEGFNCKEGTNVRLYQYNGGGAQKWKWNSDDSITPYLGGTIENVGCYNPGDPDTHYTLEIRDPPGIARNGWKLQLGILGSGDGCVCWPWDVFQSKVYTQPGPGGPENVFQEVAVLGSLYPSLVAQQWSDSKDMPLINKKGSGDNNDDNDLHVWFGVASNENANFVFYEVPQS